FIQQIMDLCEYKDFNELPENIKNIIIENYKQIDFKYFEINKYFEDYLQHVMVYDRDDIVSMCYDLGKQIEKKYPDTLHSPHSIFITTPRGGHEILSIFAYTNDLAKEQLPSHIRNISKDEEKRIKKMVKRGVEFPFFTLPNELGTYRNITEAQEAYKHLQEGNYPIIPDIWLSTMSNFFRNEIKTVFIIDDIIASGEQMKQAVPKLLKFFNEYRTTILDEFVDVIPIVLAKRKDWFEEYHEYASVFEKTLYITETVGLEKWDKARELIQDQRKGFITPKPELIVDYDKLITVRFPWGSPDGESDKILTTLYESRRGLERIERKQRRCSIEPDACELK
ncbi:hypothetical protein KKF82_05430, partial [Patescibacteria group bacterium]|nr:hypothetical protein [Patescibacteria group bacterium]